MPMRYVCYELDEDAESYYTWREHFINYFAIKLAPKVNPDFHDKYHNVVYWWLELNEESVPVREIGFDDDGEVIVAAPFARNKGFL